MGPCPEKREHCYPESCYARVRSCLQWAVSQPRHIYIYIYAYTRTDRYLTLARLVSVARGEQDYFSPDNIPTATEGCRSNALVRCCKDLGIASELWDPRWIRKYKAEHTREAWVEHVVNKKKAKIWVRKDDEVAYPWRETRQASVTKPPPA